MWFLCWLTCWVFVSALCICVVGSCACLSLNLSLSFCGACLFLLCVWCRLLWIRSTVFRGKFGQIPCASLQKFHGTVAKFFQFCSYCSRPLVRKLTSVMFRNFSYWKLCSVRNIQRKLSFFLFLNSTICQVVLCLFMIMPYCVSYQ